MNTYRATIHRTDGEPATVIYLTAQSTAHALSQAARTAIKNSIPIATVEIDE